MQRQQVVLMGRRRSDGNPTPLDCNDAGELYTAATPARKPLYATITANGTAQQLSTAAGDGAETSQAAWILLVPGGGASVRLGTSTVTASTQLQIEAYATGQRRWVIPSSSLANHWIISEGADVALELSGEQDV